MNFEFVFTVWLSVWLVCVTCDSEIDKGSNVSKNNNVEDISLRMAALMMMQIMGLRMKCPGMSLSKRKQQLRAAKMLPIKKQLDR